MKSPVFLLILFLLFSCCKQKRQKEFFIISTDIDQVLKGEVLLKGGENNYWYDIQLTENYIGVLNYESDTVFELYDLKDLKRIHFDTEKYRNNLLRFIKKEANDYTLTWSVLNNRNKMYKRCILEGDSIIEQVSYLPDYDGLPILSESVLVDKEVYGIPLEPRFLSTFYRFIPNEERIIGEPFIQEPTFQKEPLAYLSHFAVNQQRKKVVTGLRFYNILYYYTISGDLLYTGMWGDTLLIPVNNSLNKKPDIERSTKHFISLQATPTKIYCLYAGTSNKDERASTVIVLDWNGIPKDKLQLDRAITSFSVDESKGILVGISPVNKGTEIVTFKL